MARTGTYLKMLVVGVVVCVGGPALVQYVRPTDEELFKRYNPDLQRASLENRDRREQEFDDYVTKLKEWSKSNKSIWFAAKEEEARRKQSQQMQTSRQKEEERSQREDMRRELQGGR